MIFTEWLDGREEGEFNPPDAKEFEYLACVLHAASQKELIRAAQRYLEQQTGSLIPPHWVGRCHHMTVKYAPTKGDMRALAGKFGKPFLLKVDAFAHDPHGLAVIVKGDINSSQAVPHITIAHSPEVGSVYSNDLLKDKSKWHRYLEIGDLYSVLMGVRKDNTVWPSLVTQLASPTIIVK